MLIEAIRVHFSTHSSATEGRKATPEKKNFVKNYGRVCICPTVSSRHYEEDNHITYINSPMPG